MRYEFLSNSLYIAKMHMRNITRNNFPQIKEKKMHIL